MLAYIIPIRIKISFYLRFQLHFTPREYISILCESRQFDQDLNQQSRHLDQLSRQLDQYSVTSTHLDSHYGPDDLTLSSCYSLRASPCHFALMTVSPDLSTYSALWTLSVLQIDDAPLLSCSCCLTLAITLSTLIC